MLTAILTAILSAPIESNIDLTVFKESDGGIAARVWCDGVTSSGGSGGPSYVNALIDGGSITVANFPVTQPVSGTLTCNAGSGTLAVSGPLTDSQLRASAVPVSLASTTITGTAAVTQSGTWNVNNVSGTVSLPTGASTAANQTTLGSQTTKINDGTDTAQVTATSGGSLQVECTAGCGSPATPVMYTYQTPNAVGGANKLHVDMFNASGSGKIIKILGIYPYIKTDVAVTGALAIRFDVTRTSAVGTGGTAASYKSATIDVAGGNITPADTSSANLPAQITARHLPTAGATVSEWLFPGWCFVEETNAATYTCANRTNFLIDYQSSNQSLTLREGQGLLIRQGAVASVNNIAFRIVFTTE